MNAVQQEVLYSENDSPDDAWLAAVGQNGRTRVIALMQINDCDVRFQVDCAAEVNTICQKYVKKAQVTETSQNLVMWNKIKMKPLGKAILAVTNPKDGTMTDVEYVVVKNEFVSLLGLNTIKQMGLITINEKVFIAQVTSHTIDETEPLGDQGMTSLEINENIQPRILPCRKIPLAIQTDVKQELDKLVKRGVLVAVEQPTQWVSQMATPRKANGKIGICIHPQLLNTASQREHYKLPNFEDALTDLHNAKVFNKLDVKEAYWHAPLDEEAVYLLL